MGAVLHLLCVYVVSGPCMMIRGIQVAASVGMGHSQNRQKNLQGLPQKSIFVRACQQSDALNCWVLLAYVPWGRS